MALPRLLAHLNKRFLNPKELKKGGRPVLTHVGRSSGKTFETPLDAHPVDGGFIFFPLYGSESDWVKNILTAKAARLTIEGRLVDLVSPRLITRDVALAQIPSNKRPPGILRIGEFLQMDSTP